jgi:alkylation response protein AidB-like acyl-CoA dehydrogenase
VLPVASVAVDDTWDALGLRGTGSCDYSVDDVFVPAERTFHVTEPPRRGGHVHRLPMHAFLTPDHTAVTLGSARRAIDAAAQQSIGKVRLGSTTALDARATFRRDLGRSATRLRAARALVREVLAELDAADNVPAELLLEARVAATHAAEAAVEVATFAYRSGGAHAVSDRSDVGRAYRDTMTSTQHVHVLDDVYEQLGDLTLRPQAPGTS